MIYIHPAGNLEVGVRYKVSIYELGQKNSKDIVAIFNGYTPAEDGHDRLRFKVGQGIQALRYVIRSDDLLSIEQILPRGAYPRSEFKHNSHIKTDETDPSGLHQSDAGTKFDAGKIYADDIHAQFSRALEAIFTAATFGANKYTLNGWIKVEDGERRYRNAAARHRLKRQQGEVYDHESGLDHEYHEAWNVLAALELKLRREA